jgi:ubiquinone biosynthesis monooxygenase Coq7
VQNAGIKENMTNNQRHYSKVDQFCLGVDRLLRPLSNILAGTTPVTLRAFPAAATPEASLTATERKHAAGLMRVNHAGEVAAQALYHAQGLVSRETSIQQQMQAAGLEEGDHLAWCEQRICELGSHTSYLNPVWYAGSFMIGLAAGLAGDKWSLGFVAETERQVVNHLQTHLEKLPSEDLRSAQVLRQMQLDEAQHRDTAIHAGANVLPDAIKKIMQFTASFMVKAAYWI